MSKVEEKPGAAIAQRAEAGPITKALLGDGPFPQVDPKLISERIDAALLTAETPEDLFKIGATIPLESLFGRPLEVTAIVPRPSKLEGEGLDGYLICEATALDDGEAVVFTTSARNVVIRLGIAADRGWLPFRFKVRKAEKASDSGFYPYIVESV